MLRNDPSPELYTVYQKIKTAVIGGALTADSRSKREWWTSPS